MCAMCIGGAYITGAHVFVAATPSLHDMAATKIQARFQEKDSYESQNLYLRSFNGDKQAKLKLKRAQTEK